MISKAPPLVLRTAAVWGTTVLAVRLLVRGQSFSLGGGTQPSVTRPEGISASDLPIRAVGKGWELDARGSTGGMLYLRGRRENPAWLNSTGAPLPIVAGDHGLIQYGSFGVFFQFTEAPPALRRARILDWALVLSFVFSIVAVAGGLALIWAITTPFGIPKPLELSSRAELLARFNIKTENVEAPQPARMGNTDAGKGILEPGAKTGAVPTGLGDMAELLSSDVGEEVQKTLRTIGSVAEALGGLHSDSTVLRQEVGMGIQGGGQAVGGAGDASASGPSEPKLTGKDAPGPGQGLSPNQILRVIMSRYGTFWACYETGLVRDPTKKGNVGVRFSITPGGFVGAAAISSSSLHNPRVEACIVRQFKSLRFPSAYKGTTGSWPFLFRPRGN